MIFQTVKPMVCVISLVMLSTAMAVILPTHNFKSDFLVIFLPLISSSFIARPFSKIVRVCSVGTSTALQGGFQGGYTLYGRVCFSVYCLESSLHLILTEKSGANAERLL